MDLIDEMMAMGPVQPDSQSNPSTCSECNHPWHGLTCQSTETKYYEEEDGATKKVDGICGCPSRFNDSE